MGGSSANVRNAHVTRAAGVQQPQTAFDYDVFVIGTTNTDIYRDYLHDISIQVVVLVGCARREWQAVLVLKWAYVKCLLTS